MLPVNNNPVIEYRTNSKISESKKNTVSCFCTKHGRLNFTYIPNYNDTAPETNQVLSIRLTERVFWKRDVVTVYSKDSLFGVIIGLQDCREALSLKSGTDFITQSSNSHLSNLHKENNPRENHVHIKRKNNQIPEFVDNFIERHLKSNSEIHKHNFRTARALISGERNIKSISFPDGSLVENNYFEGKL